jgi:hypothetical protein
MKFIREYRTMVEDGYTYDFEITGTCTDNNPESFYRIKTNDGYVPISETPFFELWNYAEKCELEINVRTTFRYVRMNKAKIGAFTLIISEIPESDVAGFLLAFFEHINRNYQ